MYYKLLRTYAKNLYGLKLVKEKKYNEVESSPKYVYYFDNLQDYYNYFFENKVDLNEFSKESLEAAIFFEFKNGYIIAFKGICDYIISIAHKLKKLQQLEETILNHEKETVEEYNTLRKK